eukprot:CAMPEP_0171135436 /NCGR_PEP_ID=MMETSP0766_2-20121228/129797_1 /TAXON_ID=439317 /ORGANISM="Gambierdiscus australes, Strain CAWD 149" /LENGTH=112 /DNA_ID=CAMNT_0011598937 /DNA_START=164 /DNA_END=499 /DNA_ORIENTATION=-
MLAPEAEQVTTKRCGLAFSFVSLLTRLRSLTKSALSPDFSERLSSSKTTTSSWMPRSLIGLPDKLSVVRADEDRVALNTSAKRPAPSSSTLLVLRSNSFSVRFFLRAAASRV